MRIPLIMLENELILNGEFYTEGFSDLQRCLYLTVDFTVAL